MIFNKKDIHLYQKNSWQFLSLLILFHRHEKDSNNNLASLNMVETLSLSLEDLGTKRKLRFRKSKEKKTIK